MKDIIINGNLYKITERTEKALFAAKRLEDKGAIPYGVVNRMLQDIMQLDKHFQGVRK